MDQQEAPHVPAAFINTIREEGTKDEACDFLQKQWNETCALSARVAELEEKHIRFLNGGLDAERAALAGMDPDTVAEWRQRVWNEAIEAAANLAFEYPAEKHGSLDAEPFKAARQATYEVGLAIEALKENGK